MKNASILAVLVVLVLVWTALLADGLQVVWGFLLGVFLAIGVIGFLLDEQRRKVPAAWVEGDGDA